MDEMILILDFGSQFTQLIARRIRELGVYAEIRPHTTTPDDVAHLPVKGVVLSGGPASVTDEGAPTLTKGWADTTLPVLGLCYGMQLLAQLNGGRLGRGTSREYGQAVVEVTDTTDLFQGFTAGERTTVWMSHGDHVEEIPAGYVALAKSTGSPFAAMANRAKKHYAIQFHPEVVHTPRGKEILDNFVRRICGCKLEWSPGNLAENIIRSIRETVPEGAHAVCALSGGVDSSVAAALVARALGDRLHCIFVDNGLLRKHESDDVMQLLGDPELKLNLKRVDARERFLKELAGVVDPEKKRKIIGRVFIEVFDEEAAKIANATHLVQGTLYPDVIESVSVKGPSAVIKTHHNVGGLPEHMKLKLIEPLREFFKDEVRRIGRELGLPDQILLRQPFPGPGLAVRTLGEVREDKLVLLREADAIFREEVMAEGLAPLLWQYFAVLLPVQSVGVMGDGRTYEWTVCLRAVVSEDGMTADWFALPESLLKRVSSRITNEVRGINRVVLDISSKPPATIEWE